MWRIEEHRRLDKQLASVPQEVLKRYEKWKDIAMISGPRGLRNIKGLHDESLVGSGRAIVHRGWAYNIESFIERNLCTSYSRSFRSQPMTIGGGKV